ncbi:MAG: ribonuclease III [Bacteroidetes bacterium]|nr:MAG: ribonuclease III [Bacteroidota bacterium]
MKAIKSFINYLLSSQKDYYNGLKTLLGFWPGNLSLYKSALRHKSAAQEVQDGFRNSNERLEFLGDAILDSVVAEFLFKRFPYKSEGFLTEMRSKIVNRNKLSELAFNIGLDHFVDVSKRNKDESLQFKSIYGNALEALIGAVYLDRGYDFAKKFTLNSLILPFINIEELELVDTNFKSKLLEWSQKENKEIKFVVIEESGLEHNKKYTVQVSLDEENIGVGEEFTKKKAEQLAAQRALDWISKNNQHVE